MSNSKVALSMKVINEAPSVKEVLEIQAVQDAWVKTYESTSGKHDGEMRFNQERILFMQTIAKSDSLAACNKFTIYSAFTELALSGLTLRDGLAYIVPMKGAAQFMPGWKGRLEQINEMPNVMYCHAPQVAYDCDEFDFELGMQPKINRHVPAKVRADGSIITHVYFVVEFAHGSQVYIMSRAEVLNIRDRRSSSYKEYAKKKASGKWEAWMEVPMWVSDEEQAFKKTLVKRVYNELPKLPKHKALDARIKDNVDVDDFTNSKGEVITQLLKNEEDQKLSDDEELQRINDMMPDMKELGDGGAY